MFDRAVLVERLDQILKACSRIERRFAGIASPEDFEITPSGEDKLDGICMMLIAIGENLKKIDKDTEGALLARYPPVPWSSVKRTRDVISHGYFDVDVEVIYDICQNRIGSFAETIGQIRADVLSDA